MNPGDDFGKRELSPALRSRFTEIWVPQIASMEDAMRVVGEMFTAASLRRSVRIPEAPASGIVAGLSQLYMEYTQRRELVSQEGHIAGDPSVFNNLSVQHVPLTLRDVRQWIEYVIEHANRHILSCDGESVISKIAWEGFGHAASLVLVDGFGLGTAADQVMQDVASSDVTLLRTYISSLGGKHHGANILATMRAFDGAD